MSRLWLFLNHADAWGMTLVISALSLVLHGTLNGDTLWIPVLLALGAWLAFAVNDLYDAPIDAADPRKAHRNVFVGSRRRQAIGVLAAGGSLAAVLYSAAGPKACALAAGCVLAAWAYSAPPLRLKARPGWDLFTHAALVETLPYLAAIWLAGAPPTPVDALAWGMLALASLSAQLEQQIRDAAFDAQFERTFTTVHGIGVSCSLLRGASALLIVLGCVGAASGAIPHVLWPGMLLTLPMIVHRLMRPAGQPRSEALIRVLLVSGLIYAGIVAALS